MSTGRLVLLAAVAALLALVLGRGALPDGGRALSPAQRLAVDNVRAAQRVLEQRRAGVVTPEHARELERTDPGHTGVVGVEWSPLVTTAGVHEAKVLSADARWAALFVTWFERAGLAPGDTVAIGASGSFPGLLLSARIAAETMGLRPAVAASIGASNFGATLPEFDIMEMDRVLVEEGLVRHPVLLVTPGGDGDVLLGLEEEDRQLVQARLAELEVRDDGPMVSVPDSLSESAGLREEVLFGAAGASAASPAGLFVNIGGHAANYGTGAVALRLPRGYIDPAGFDPGTGGDSVALRALRGGIPVVNLIELHDVLVKEQVSFADARWIPGGTAPGPWRMAAAMAALAAAAVLVKLRKTEPNPEVPTWNEQV